MGANMDVHAGGVDLKFPHHDNELCHQRPSTAARLGQPLRHFGHLHIKGLKMSKSLKNFITIRQALEDFTLARSGCSSCCSRGTRAWTFPIRRWARSSPRSRRCSPTLERSRRCCESRGSRAQPRGASASALQASLLAREAAVHTCLCDNFNTPAAMAE